MNDNYDIIKLIQTYWLYSYNKFIFITKHAFIGSQFPSLKFTNSQDKMWTQCDMKICKKLMGLARVVTSRLTWILVNHSLDCRFTRPTLHLFHALGVVLCYADKAVLSPHSMFTHLTVTDLTLGEEQCHSVSTPHRKAFSTCKSMVLCKSHVQIMTLFWANEVVVAFVACESCLFGAWKRHSTVKAIVFGCLFRKAVATLSELWDVPASADVLSSPIVIANPTFASCLVNLFITKTNTFCADFNSNF